MEEGTRRPRLKGRGRAPPGKDKSIRYSGTRSPHDGGSFAGPCSRRTLSLVALGPDRGGFRGFRTDDEGVVFGRTWWGCRTVVNGG